MGKPGRKAVGVTTTTKNYEDLLSSIGEITTPDHFGRNLLTYILARAARSDQQEPVTFSAKITVHPGVPDGLDVFVSSACIGHITPYGSLVTICADDHGEFQR
jgi:hypothetical protein